MKERRSGVGRQRADKGNRMDVECYNCGKRGHMSRFWPKNALYCPGRKTEKSIERRGTVNGQEVGNIVLDTGCSQTMVHSRLVQSDKLLEEEGVVVRCVHGDSVFYPLISVTISLEGHLIRTVAAVSDTLPASVLLGTDVRELGQLLGTRSVASPKDLSGEQQALATTTRARARDDATKEQEEHQGNRSVV